MMLDQHRILQRGRCQSKMRHSQDRMEKLMVAPKQAPATQAKNDPSKAEGKKDGKPAAPVAKRQLPSGLKYEVLKAGSGPQAQRGKNVQVRYEGRLVKSGSRFD